MKRIFDHPAICYHDFITHPQVSDNAMSQDTAIEKHYGRPGLLKRMLRTLENKGISENDLTFETLAPVDEFHVGGLDATRRILNRLTLFPQDRLVDLGCGTGGPARAIAAISGCHVSGFDLTREFIETGTTLNHMTGMADRVSLAQASILDVPAADATFSHAVMLHVGMNVADKEGIMREAFRLLRPGGRFCVYDVMQTGDGALTFPLPWASDPSFSAVVRPDAYLAAGLAAGFMLEAQHDESAGMARMLTSMSDSGPANRPDNGSDPFHNLARHIEEAVVAPTEIYLRKPGKA